MSTNVYKFTPIELPYSYDALEPYIDAETINLHYNHHLKTYIDKLNKLIENCCNLQKCSIEKIIINSKNLPAKIQTDIKNNAGGVYNHNFYFNIMTPHSTKEPVGALKDCIICTFGSFSNFKEQFKNAAINRFGSGYAWLVVNKFNKLKIISTQNQDTPLSMSLSPILLIDVWEHAYYLKYQYKRADYIENWFNVIDWEKANLIYTESINKT